jgi:membrane protease YdiL (CAAX protease family)
MQESGARHRIGFWGVCFALFLVSKTIPFLFEITLRPTGSNSLIGFPSVIRRLFGDGDVGGFSHSIGTIVQSLVVLVVARFLLQNSIKLGEINLKSFLWVLAALLIGIFSRPLFDTIYAQLLSSEKVFGSGFSSFALPGADIFAMPSFLYVVLPTILVAPIVEELIYRGFMTNLLTKYFSVAVAGVIVTLVFVLQHYQTIGSIGRVITLAMTGVLLFAARIKFNGVGTPILMHFAVNATLVLFTQ